MAVYKLGNSCPDRNRWAWSQPLVVAETTSVFQATLTTVLSVCISLSVVVRANVMNVESGFLTKLADYPCVTHMLSAPHPVPHTFLLTKDRDLGYQRKDFWNKNTLQSKVLKYTKKIHPIAFNSHQQAGRKKRRGVMCYLTNI